ncbi:MAG: IS1634 family transposase [Bacteroidota bacterium]
MFIRQVKKQRSKDSKVFYQYTLAQTSRIEGKVKQRNILYLGSDPLLEDKVNRKIVLSLLKSKIFGQPDLFSQGASATLIALAESYYEKYLIKYGVDNHPVTSIPPSPTKAEYHNIDIKGLELNDVTTFGAEHLCKQVLERLGLEQCFTSLGMSEKQSSKALLSIAGRAIFSSSEYKTSQILQTSSELQHCFGIDGKITHKQLYSIADTLYEHREQIDRFLYKRIETLFNLQDKLVIFDISNTYFETRKQDSALAQYGRSKEKRNDCPLVVFTGVINPEGFIRHSRIYQGNTPDTATLGDMIEDLASNCPKTTKQTIVIDAGIATEENLQLIKQKGYQYVCVSRKLLKHYPKIAPKDKVLQLTDRDKSKVELAIFQPDGYDDTWMQVQSQAKSKKETSMQNKLAKRFEQELHSIAKAITTKGGTKKINKVWERIGRAKQKYNRVAANYHIEVEEKQTIATALKWKYKVNKTKEDKQKGIYFIRTSYQNPKEKELWDIYNTIREVETTFRCLKTQLNIRPIHHQNDERIKSHIYLTILAYQLVNTIRHMLKANGIHHDWRNIVRIMSTQTIQTIELPTDKKTIHLRKPSKPIEEVQQIYKATKCKQTQSAIKKYVVYH